MFPDGTRINECVLKFHDAENPVHERQPADRRDGRHDGEREGAERRGRYHVGVRRERVRLDKGYPETGKASLSRRY